MPLTCSVLCQHKKKTIQCPLSPFLLPAQWLMFERQSPTQVYRETARQWYVLPERASQSQMKK